MKIDDFDYPFDPSLIARYPSPKRDQSRLLVLERQGGKIGHRRFFEIGDYFKRGDVLVLNNTKVTPCRIAGKKAVTGGHVELLLIRRQEGDTWEAMAGGRLRIGTKILFSPSCCGEVIGHQDGHVVVKFSYEGEWNSILSKIGQMPIPPYIRRDPVEEDREWYQTVYAAKEGAIAAPTAGLHFTEEMLGSLRAKGISVACITLHVGIGTFKPVKVEWIEGHQMESEWFEVGGEAVEQIGKAKAGGGRVVCVGTTSVRALEQAAASGEFRNASGETGLFIYPGFQFRVTDAVITNFHLPKSTLLMLVMAFAGRENILKAYEEAVKLRYRFYSYGDAMLII